MSTCKGSPSRVSALRRGKRLCSWSWVGPWSCLYIDKVKSRPGAAGLKPGTPGDPLFSQSAPAHEGSSRQWRSHSPFSAHPPRRRTAFRAWEPDEILGCIALRRFLGCARRDEGAYPSWVCDREATQHSPKSGATLRARPSWAIWRRCSPLTAP